MDSRLRTALGLMLTFSPMVGTGCIQFARQPVTAHPVPRAEIVMNSARLEESRGNLTQALQLYAEVNQQEPMNADCLQRMGVISTHLNMPDAANRYYKMAYEINPNNAELLADMGFSAFQRKDYEKAEIFLEQSVRLNSSNARIIDNLAIARAWRHKDEASLVAFRMVHEDAEAKRRLAAIQASRDAVVATNSSVKPAVATQSAADLAIEIPVLPPVTESLSIELPQPSNEPLAQLASVPSPLNFSDISSSQTTSDAQSDNRVIQQTLPVEPIEAFELPPKPAPPMLPKEKKAVALVIPVEQPVALDSEKPFKPADSSKPMTACRPVNPPQPIVSQTSATVSESQTPFVHQPAEVEIEIEVPDEESAETQSVPENTTTPQIPAVVDSKKTTSRSHDQPSLVDCDSSDCDGTTNATPNWRHIQGAAPNDTPATITISPDQWRKTSRAISYDGDTQANLQPISLSQTASDDHKNGWGICLVSLVENNRLERGLPSHSLDYQSMHLKFASEYARKKFIESPERYLPANDGNDVVAKSDWGSSSRGSIQFASWYQRRLYLFSSRENLESFRRAPQRFVSDK